MANNTFAAKIDAWARKSETRMRAIVRESAQRVFNEANIVGPSVANPGGGEGGKMPVDTGFLRASFVVDIGSMPAGPSRGAPGGSYAADTSYTLKLKGMKLGDTVYGGWSAQYAVYMEHRYGFMRSAAQNWQPIVAAVVQEAKARFP